MFQTPLKHAKFQILSWSTLFYSFKKKQGAASADTSKGILYCFVDCLELLYKDSCPWSVANAIILMRHPGLTCTEEFILVQEGTCELWTTRLRDIQPRWMYGQSKPFKEMFSPFIWLIFLFCLCICGCLFVTEYFFFSVWLWIPSFPLNVQRIKKQEATATCETE